jgi:uncharacterized protein (TIGR02646 family)
MRKLGKPRSPRNVSPDGQPRQSMQQAEKAFLVALRSAADAAECARSAFDALEKRNLRSVLYEEQGYLCVYCERRIAEGQQPCPRIDHWRPLSKNPNLALHWHNLYLCCATETTCDCRKGQSVLRADDQAPDLPWPVALGYDRCLGFTSKGEIYVRSDAPLSDAQRRVLALAVGIPHNAKTRDNGILNLNHPTLIAARAAAVESECDRLEDDYKGKTASKDDRAARAAAMLAERRLQEFVSIRVGWLTKTLSKGR